MRAYKLAEITSGPRLNRILRQILQLLLQPFERKETTRLSQLNHRVSMFQNETAHRISRSSSIHDYKNQDFP